MNSRSDAVRAMMKCSLFSLPRNDSNRANDVATSRNAFTTKVFPEMILSSRMFTMEHEMAMVENDAVMSIVRDEKVSYSHTVEYL